MIDRTSSAASDSGSGGGLSRKRSMSGPQSGAEVSWISSSDSSSASPCGGEARRKAHARSTRPADTRSAAARSALHREPPRDEQEGNEPPRLAFGLVVP